MALSGVMRVGLLGVAHVHTDSYVGHLAARTDAALVGAFDHDAALGESFSARTGVPFVGWAEDLVEACDALVVCAENTRHAELVRLCGEKGKAVLVEKPVGVSEADFAVIEAAAARCTVMTAFPCRFSPAYAAAKRRIDAGEIGTVRAVCATNRGQCPGGWFVDKALSGGGAMMDHTVHVADLLRDLLGEEPSDVRAETGNGMRGGDVEDVAMLTLAYPSGVVATLDASWSRTASHRIWGDVMMTIVGEEGVIELDLFGAGVTAGGRLHGYGTDLDGLMVAEFLRAARDGSPRVTAADGIAAARVALAGYSSIA